LFREREISQTDCDHLTEEELRTKAFVLDMNTEMIGKMMMKNCKSENINFCLHFLWKVL